MKMSVLLLVILFGLTAAHKPVSGYGVPKPSETYAPQRVPSYVVAIRPKPSKSEEIKAKISSKKDAIHTKLEELKPKVEAKIYSTKEAIAAKLEALKPKIEEFKENLKAKIPIVKSHISDKLSDIKSKLESKKTQSEHHGPKYVLVRVQPKSKYSRQ